MSQLNITSIKNKRGDFGPNLVGYSTVTGDLNVTGNLKVGGGVTVSGITTFSGDISFDSDVSIGGTLTAVDITSSGNISVGDSITLYSATGVVTAAKFHGDGSELVNLPSSAGLGTALSEDSTSPLNYIYYTDQVLAVGSTVTVDAPDSSKVAYTQYSQVALTGDADLIVAPGDDFIPDILGIGTTGVGSGTLAGDGGRIRADNLTNRAGTGAPTAGNGFVVTGVATATTFDGNLTGNITGSTIVGENLDVTGVTTTSNLVIENSAYTAITTTSINKTIVNREFCTVVTSSASTALGLTITLPASPQPGWLCGVGIGGTFLDTEVGRNGSNIMNLSEDFKIDVAHINVSFLYIDNTYGWKVV